VKVYDFGGWMEDCDAGFSVTSLSRPAYESVLRNRVAALPNITLRGETPSAASPSQMANALASNWKMARTSPPISSSTRPASPRQ